jgi:hypothetical protein
MVPAITIVLFWLIAGLVGARWMKHMVYGFPAAWVVDLSVVVWGILVAIVVRWMITGLEFGVIATLVMYFVGAVVCGPPRQEQERPLEGVSHELSMTDNPIYARRQVVSNIPLIVYIVLSAILFFVWK